MTRWYATCCKVLGYKLASFRGKLLQRDPRRSRILMFHDIVPDESSLRDEYACSVGELAHTVEIYLKMGFRFVSLDQLLEMAPKDAERGYCVLTFDDGLASVYSQALPLLTGLGVPFTVYMIADCIGRDGYLSAEELRSLCAYPLCAVGSHSVTHPMFRFLSKNDVLYELAESRRRLEGITGRPIRHFAFPYGSAYACSGRDIRLAKRAGYASAVLTTAALLSRFSLKRRYSLPRLDRSDGTPVV